MSREQKLLYIPNKNKSKSYLFFRTCKPTRDPLFGTYKICLTGEGNRKSFPVLQFEIVECGLDEFCKPSPFGQDLLPVEFGYVFLCLVLLQVPKCFVPDQIFIYILCQLQTFCARSKDDLHSVKFVFVLAQKFLKRH